MKVLIIHSTYKQRGGEDAVVAAETQLLADNGINTSVLTFTNSKLSLLKYLLLPFNPFSYRKTRRKIKTFAPDIIHIHNLHFAGSNAIIYAAKKSKTPLVYTLHNFRLICPSGTLFHKGNLFFNSLKVSFPWDAVKRKVYNNSYFLSFWLAANIWLTKKTSLWKNVDRFITLSEPAKEIFLSSSLGLTKDQLTVKQNFVVVNQPAATTTRNEYFLFVGRLTEEKGIKVLLDSFVGSSCQLRIIGDGPFQAVVKETAAANSNITYLGFKDKHAIRNEMESCTALIFPSIWLEGMPVTIIEAFAAGTPVIASNLGTMQTMIQQGRNGLHFEAGNSIALKKTISDWQRMDNKDRCSYYEHAYKSYQNNYTEKENYKLLSAIYQTVLSDEKRKHF